MLESRYVPILKAFFDRLEQYDRVSEEERAIIADLLQAPQEIRRETAIIKEGDRPHASTLLLQGFAYRFRHLSSGRRVIQQIHVPGDFVDLHSFPLKEMDHSVAALGGSVITRAPHEKLRLVTEQFPHMTRLLWLSTLVDGAIAREWATGLAGRRSLGRLAHLILELHLRLDAVGRDGNNEFEVPFSQEDLGDMLGISAIHVNRVLQELRNSGAVAWSGSKVKILDRDALVEIGEFDDRYLHQRREPR